MHSREVAAWPAELIELIYKTDFDRIKTAREDDGDVLRGSFRHQPSPSTSASCDQRNPTTDQVGGQFFQLILLAPGPIVFDRDIPALDIAGLLEALMEC